MAYNRKSYPSTNIKNTQSLTDCIKPITEVLGIDEVQFFDDPLKDFILENKNKYLMIATALQLDFRGDPFKLRSPESKEIESETHVGELMPYSKIIPKYPQCTYNDGNSIYRLEAIYIQRFREDETLAPYNDPTVVVGGTDLYDPRCIEHFKIPQSG